MIDRCYNPNNARHHNFKKHSITVCQRWLDSYDNFLTDMGNRPCKEFGLGRIDLKGNYSPENCKWMLLTSLGRVDSRWDTCSVSMSKDTPDHSFGLMNVIKAKYPLSNIPGGFRLFKQYGNVRIYRYLKTAGDKIQPNTKYGCLTTIRVKEVGKRLELIWECLCDCGKLCARDEHALAKRKYSTKGRCVCNK